MLCNAYRAYGRFRWWSGNNRRDHGADGSATRQQAGRKRRVRGVSNAVLTRAPATVARPVGRLLGRLVSLSAACALVACAASTGSTPDPTCARSACRDGDAARTVVSLTFDDAYQNQWLYAVPLLQAQHMLATFYVITSDSDGPYACCMSWMQLRTLQRYGHDVGSHTITHPYLTRISEAQARREVCGSRRDMQQKGIRDPTSFAYPFGTYDAAAERIVRECGFTNARVGGGVSASNSVPGPPYAERLPAVDPFAVRTIAVDGSDPMQLADLERFVRATAAHGGGWLPITFHNVCDSYASDYERCMASYGPIDDGVLTQFLSWLRTSGQVGGAPAGLVVETMRDAIRDRG
jgi:peptidoglycan/xylan/chitin deacetylase (PgdA/CDA1 family)